MQSRYLLLHGSWHGAWCWFKVAPRLEPYGEVIVPNLPGRARGLTWAPTVTLGRMVRAVAPLLSAPVPTTIVAHSRYGILATALAEAFPAAIARVVYLASFLLADNGRAVDAFAEDKDSFIRPFVRVSRMGAWDALAPEAYVEGLYADCSPDDIRLASSLLCREPSLPAVARVHTTEARFGRVPKAYVRLARDRAVSPQLQDRMIDAARVERVETLQASHSAYFSQPDELVAAIRKLEAA